MKNVRIVDSFDDDDIDDTLPEYELDYSKARPNPYLDTAPVTVVLDNDVAKIFATSESVNNALRAILRALPENALPH